MSFIIILLILLLVFYLAGPWLASKLKQRAIRSWTDYLRSQYEQQRAPRNQEPQQPPVRRKVFTKEEGEYIEYEDLDGTYTYTATETRTVVEESQVSDAEWEEI